MKRVLIPILFIISLFISELKAQNPFEKYGYHVKVLTMTNGKFNEFFDLDSIQQVGDVLINTHTMKVIGFAQKDSINPRPDAQLISRWISPDPLAEKYWSISPYAYAANTPINAIDPDGKRVYFVAGAGNDQDGWNYVNRFNNAFTQGGIQGFTRINATHGWQGDAYFTAMYRHSRYEAVTTGVNMNNHVAGLAPATTTEYRIAQEEQISNAITQMKNNLSETPLEEGEQLNMAGYCYGSVVQAHAALQMADEGYKIDNVILIGSPISDKSDLYKSLTGHKNIGNVLRIDIEGDLLSNPQDIWDFLGGAAQNAPGVGEGDNGPHFDLARPGQETNDRIQQVVVEWLKQQGVK